MKNKFHGFLVEHIKIRSEYVCGTRKKGRMAIEKSEQSSGSPNREGNKMFKQMLLLQPKSSCCGRLNAYKLEFECVLARPNHIFQIHRHMCAPHTNHTHHGHVV